MTGYKLYKRVCSLLGYNDFGTNEDTKSGLFLSILNQICEDLKIAEIKSLSDEIIFEAHKKEALIYGSAMLFSASLNDSGCADMYTSIYNSKRSKALSETDTRKDVLPKPLNGGV